MAVTNCMRRFGNYATCGMLFKDINSGTRPTNKTTNDVKKQTTGTQSEDTTGADSADGQKWQRFKNGCYQIGGVVRVGAWELGKVIVLNIPYALCTMAGFVYAGSFAKHSAATARAMTGLCGVVIPNLVKEAIQRLQDRYGYDRVDRTRPPHPLEPPTQHRLTETEEHDHSHEDSNPPRKGATNNIPRSSLEPLDDESPAKDAGKPYRDATPQDGLRRRLVPRRSEVDPDRPSNQDASRSTRPKSIRTKEPLPES